MGDKARQNFLYENGFACSIGAGERGGVYV